MVLPVSGLLGACSPLYLLSGLSLGVDLLSAMAQTDLVGWACLAVLLFLSVRSGYFMFSKYWEIRRATQQSYGFIEECLEGHKSLPEIYRSSSDYPDSPLAALLQEAYLEYEVEVRDNSLAGMPLEQRAQLGKMCVEGALERTIAAEMRKLESKLVHLATVSSLAPYIGLFGTVWGVLAAFQRLGIDGAGIENLAPGISTALITTVFGLLLAIPTSAMYNHLTASVAHLASQMDSFAHELGNVFQKTFLRREEAA